MPNLLQSLSDRIIDRAVTLRLRKTITPEHVHELINDMIAMLHNGLGQIGIEPSVFDAFLAGLDKDELAGMLAPRLLHYLGA